MSKVVFFRGFQLVLIAIVLAQATFQNTAQHHSTDSTNSSVSSAAAQNATFAAVFPTDATTIEPVINPSGKRMDINNMPISLPANQNNF